MLSDLRSNNPSNLNFCYLNINSVRNKFTDFQEIINGNVDVISIAETKIDASFPSAQFVFEGYHSPYRLDVSNRSGGILVYVKSSIPSRRLSCDNLCDSIQAVPFEINLRKEKWLVISIFFFNWYSLHARLNSHYEAWSYKKRKHKKVKAYRKSI